MSSFEEKLAMFASARASAARATILYNGEFLDRWFPKLAGRFVSGGSENGYPTRPQAIRAAKAFREKCANWPRPVS